MSKLTKGQEAIKKCRIRMASYSDKKRSILNKLVNLLFKKKDEPAN